MNECRSYNANFNYKIESINCLISLEYGNAPKRDSINVRTDIEKQKCFDRTSDDFHC